jgi:hypothetical protein
MNVKNALLISAATVGLLVASQANATTTVINLPSTATGLSGPWKGAGYVYDPTGVAGITFSGQAGLSNARAPFFTPATPNGEAGIFLQSGSVAGIQVTGISGAGEVDISLASVPGGVETLTFYDIMRPGNVSDPYSVLYNGAVIASFTSTSKTVWTQRTVTFTEAAGGTLSFIGNYSSADWDVAISDIAISTTALASGITATPELSTSLMLSLGIFGFGLAAWRKRETEA